MHNIIITKLEARQIKKFLLKNYKNIYKTLDKFNKALNKFIEQYEPNK